MSDITTEAEQGTQPQDQTSVTPADVQPASQGQGSGPWMSDLQALGLDANSISAVDGFLREKVQPRVTQLEQRIAEADAATRLYSDLNNDPVDTYLAITEELYGSEVAQQVLDMLQAGQEPEPQPAQTPNALDPRVEKVVTHFEREMARNEYESAKQRVLAANPDVDGDLLDPFVAAAEGDFDAAVQGYKSYYAKVVEKVGGQLAQPADETATPPPALGSDTAARTAPPVQKSYANFDEALDDFFSERGAAPPTVGGV